jgi:hypothetical protein
MTMPEPIQKTKKPKLMDRLTRAQKVVGGIITALAGLAGAAALFLGELSKLFNGSP